MMQFSSLLCLAPDISLAVFACIFLILGLFIKCKTINILSTLVSGSAFLASIFTKCIPFSSPWPQIMQLDAYTMVSKSGLYLLSLAIFLIMVTTKYKEDNDRYENSIIILFLMLGSASVMSSVSFIPLYVAVEIQSIASYALLCSNKNTSIALKETAVKYVITGAVSSCIMLFGISLIYLYAGTMYFGDIKEFIHSASSMPPGFLVGVFFMITGMCFKLSLFPMHTWAPNVYETAPNFITLVISTIPKFAFGVFFIRFIGTYFIGDSLHATAGVLSVLGLISVILGSLSALKQDDIKRMLGYASISHMGHIVIAMSSGTQFGMKSAILYLSVYILMTFAFFCFLIAFGNEFNKVSDLPKLRISHPISAFFLCVLIFSMAGIPPLLGFFTKFAVIKSIIEVKMLTIAVLLLVANVISSYYYLRLIKGIYIYKTSGKTCTISNCYAMFCFWVVSSINLLYILFFYLFKDIIPGVAFIFS